MPLHDTTNDIPCGYCQCGCGEKTNIAPRTDTRRGWTKGKPLRFIAQHHNRRPFTERFWNLVSVAEPNECWLWVGAISDTGYGTMGVNGKTTYAHRVSWQIHHQPIPDDMLICHHCDVRACVNPAHLFLGTQSDNIQDREKKGRANRTHGSQHHWAKLTDEQIAEVCRLATNGMTIYGIAKTFSMSWMGIRKILNRKGYQHIP